MGPEKQPKLRCHRPEGLGEGEKEGSQMGLLSTMLGQLLPELATIPAVRRRKFRPTMEHSGLWM